MAKKPAFRPGGFPATPAMELYAFKRAKLGDSVENTTISAEVGVHPGTITNWKQKEGFEQWLVERIYYYRAPIREMLEQVALKNINDFRFWEVLAKKTGLITTSLEEMFKDMNEVDIVRAVKKRLAELQAAKIAKEPEKQIESA